jgi:predicted phosphodiesterase
MTIIKEIMNQSQYDNFGIIADSHGKFEKLAKAIKFLRDNDCKKIFHLGDICDSFQPGTCNQCIEALKKENVIAVKGNNDHVLEINQMDYNESLVSRSSISYLQALPPVFEYKNAIFAHSLPFFKELGISCITKVMGKAEINKFFSEPHNKILFRGHNHDPEIIWIEEKIIKSEKLLTGQKISLDNRLPCIVTCGALTRGLCLIWNIRENELKSLSFK